MNSTAPELYNLYIYTNEECNLGCRHCWVTAKLSNTVRTRHVTLEMYKQFISQAIPLGLGYVKISGGEALLSRDQVLELVQFTHQHRIATRIETNGTLIDEEVARVFSQTRTAVSVSLDGSNAARHEAMRMVPGCFDATMEGLHWLRTYRIPVEIIMSVYKDNEDDLINVVKIASTLHRGRVKINPVLSSGRGRKMEKKGERLSATELYNFIKRIESEYRQLPVPVLVSSEPAYHSLEYIMKELVAGGRCGFKSLLGILANGNISFCGMGYRAPEFLFGHVSDINLNHVWNSHPTLEDIRNKIPEKLEGICGNCIMKHTCQGACRSTTFETYGSITAPSPGCQALYEAGLFPKSRMIDPLKNCDYEKPALLTVLN